MKWLPLMVFAVFGFYLVGNNFQAKLGMIDDHEIAMFLGADGVIKPTEIPSVIMSTEVGKWGTYLRYRPSYYSLRVIESALWRDNATLWYFSRYLMLVFGMWIGWKIAAIYFPKIVAYIFIFYLMTIPFWSDLLTRLGPSEIYGIIAIPLFVYGIIRSKLWMIATGYVVAIGAKENFLILFPILLLYVIYRIYKKLITHREVVVYGLISLYTLFIVLAIAKATASAGADIYGASISYSDRFALLYSYKRYIVESRHLQLALMVFTAGTMNLGVMIYQKGLAILRRNIIVNHLLVALVVGILIISQYIFYNSQIPSNIRYDFPVMLLFPILQMIAVSLAIKLLPPKILGAKISLIVYLMVFAGMLSIIVKRGYSPLQQQAQKITDTTQIFQQQLSIVETKLLTDPATSLVFVSEGYLDFEPIVSVSRFLTSRKINNKFILDYHPKEKIKDPMILDDRLRDVMKGQVGNDGIFDRFTEYEIDGKPCLSITFGAAASHPTCPEIARF